MTYTVIDIVIIFVAMIAAFVIGSKLLKSTEISMALAGVVAVIISTPVVGQRSPSRSSLRACSPTWIWR